MKLTKHSSALKAISQHLHRAHLNRIRPFQQRQQLLKRQPEAPNRPTGIQVRKPHQPTKRKQLKIAFDTTDPPN